MTGPVQPVVDPGLSDADYWEALVSAGTPKDVATRIVQARSGQSSGGLASHGTVRTALDNFANGVLWNVGDRLSAAASSIAHSGGHDLSLYHFYLDALQNQRTANAAAHPVAAVGGNIAGAVASPLNRLLPVGGSGALGIAARGAAGGAIAGGVAGAGDAPAGQVVPGAIKGAAAGSVLGALLPGGIALARQTFSPPLAAATRLASVVQKAGGADALNAEAQRLAGLGRGAETMLADLSPKLGALADQVATTSDDARNVIQAATQGRQEEQAQRVLTDVRAGLGGVDPSIAARQAALESSRRAWANQAYAALREGNPAVGGAVFPSAVESPVPPPVAPVMREPMAQAVPAPTVPSPPPVVATPAVVRAGAVDALDALATTLGTSRQDIVRRLQNAYQPDRELFTMREAAVKRLAATKTSAAPEFEANQELPSMADLQTAYRGQAPAVTPTAPPVPAPVSVAPPVAPPSAPPVGAPVEPVRAAPPEPPPPSANGSAFQSAAGNLLAQPKIARIWKEARDVGLIGTMPDEAAQAVRAYEQAAPAAQQAVESYQAKLQQLVEQGVPEAKARAALGPEPTLPDAPAPSYEMLHNMKQMLDRAVTRAYTRREGDLGARLGSVRDALNGFLEQHVSGYAETNAEYAARSRAIRALVAGAKAWGTNDVPGLVQQMRGMDPAELEQFRAGMASKLVEQLSRAKTNRDVATALSNAGSAEQAKLRVVFGDQPTFERFMQQMAAERQLSALKGATAGSPTARRLNAGANAVATALGSVGLYAHNPALAAGALATKGVQMAAQRAMERQAAELAPMLTTAGPQDIQRLLDQLLSARRATMSPALQRALGGGTGVVGAGLASP